MLFPLPLEVTEMLNISGLKLPMIGDHLVGGDVYFVDSGGDVANDENNGLHPTNSPCATYSGANAKCTANNGDFIVMLPGHAESITAAVTPVAGTTVIGIGNGNNRPTITVNADIDGLSITNANVKFHNIKLVPGTSSAIGTKLFHCGGGVGLATFHKCHFQITAAQKLYHIGAVKGAKGLPVTFEECLFENLSTVALPANATWNHTALNVHTGDVDVIGCRFIDMGAQKKNAWAQCAMVGSTGTGEDLCNVMFKDCVFNCRGIAVKARAAAVSARITIADCRGISTSSNTAMANIFQVTYANMIDTYAVGAVNKRATLVPAATE
jgi:hypothetical protein